MEQHLPCRAEQLYHLCEDSHCLCCDSACPAADASSWALHPLELADSSAELSNLFGWDPNRCTAEWPQPHLQPDFSSADCTALVPNDNEMLAVRTDEVASPNPLAFHMSNFESAFEVTNPAVLSTDGIISFASSTDQPLEVSQHNYCGTLEQSPDVGAALIDQHAPADVQQMTVPKETLTPFCELPAAKQAFEELRKDYEESISTVFEYLGHQGTLDMITVLRDVRNAHWDATVYGNFVDPCYEPGTNVVDLQQRLDRLTQAMDPLPPDWFFTNVRSLFRLVYRVFQESSAETPRSSSDQSGSDKSGIISRSCNTVVSWLFRHLLVALSLQIDSILASIQSQVLRDDELHEWKRLEHEFSRFRICGDDWCCHHTLDHAIERLVADIVHKKDLAPQQSRRQNQTHGRFKDQQQQHDRSLYTQNAEREATKRCARGTKRKCTDKGVDKSASENPKPQNTIKPIQGPKTNADHRLFNTLKRPRPKSSSSRSSGGRYAWTRNHGEIGLKFLQDLNKIRSRARDLEIQVNRRAARNPAGTHIPNCAASTSGSLDETHNPAGHFEFNDDLGATTACATTVHQLAVGGREPMHMASQPRGGLFESEPQVLTVTPDRGFTADSQGTEALSQNYKMLLSDELAIRPVVEQSPESIWAFEKSLSELGLEPTHVLVKFFKSVVDVTPTLSSDERFLKVTVLENPLGKALKEIESIWNALGGCPAFDFLNYAGIIYRAVFDAHSKLSTSGPGPIQIQIVENRASYVDMKWRIIFFWMARRRLGSLLEKVLSNLCNIRSLNLNEEEQSELKVLETELESYYTCGGKWCTHELDQSISAVVARLKPNTQCGCHAEHSQSLLIGRQMNVSGIQTRSKVESWVWRHSVAGALLLETLNNLDSRAEDLRKRASVLDPSKKPHALPQA